MEDLKLLPEEIANILEKQGIKELRPCQKKAVENGLIEGTNLLVCTPTASGKTLIAEIAAINKTIKTKGKTIYIVPLIALANEKYKEFKKKYENTAKTAISVSDLDSTDAHLIDYDIIICTAEKLDSLIRHRAVWLSFVSLVVIDEIHLLNDTDRGPTLEVLITLLKILIPTSQIIGLSATIGNPKELAEWLKAKLIIDNWRPVPLKKGVFYADKIEYIENFEKP